GLNWRRTEISRQTVFFRFLRESTFRSRRCRYGDRRINLTSFPWLPSVSPHHAPTILRGGAEQKVTKVTKESGRTPAETLLFNVAEFCRRSALACRSRKCWLLRGGHATIAASQTFI